MDPDQSLDLLERLLDGPGREMLDSLPPYSESSVLSLQSTLRGQGHDPALIAAALTQSRLRARAVDKFGDRAAEMFFTADGLEQSTRMVLAHRHAARFAAAGVTLVHDLGCGLGADAIAFAEAGLQVQAVDADPVTARMADANLSRWPGAGAHRGRAEDVGLSGGGEGQVGVWLDPARRVTGVADLRGRTKRVFSLDAISPSWDRVQEFAAQVPATGAKLSPAFPHAALPAGAEAQWSSWHGEVLECTLWWGPLVESAGRTAAVVTPDATHVVTEADAEPGEDTPFLDSLDDLGEYLYEPDRAVTRSGLTGALVAAVDGAELGSHLGFVTSDAASGPGWARRFRVRAAMHHTPKAVTRWLREHGHDRITVKTRGVQADPDMVRRQLKMTGKGKGGSEAVILVTRVGASQVVLVLDPS